MSPDSKVTDMTVGSPLRHILIFTLPLLVGNLFQQLYNIVDSVVVGNFVGAGALAAVGTCGSLGYLFFSLSSGLTIGIGIMAAQYFGARNEAMVRTTVANSVIILLGAGVLVTVVGIAAAPALLQLLHTPKEILPDAVLYLRTICAGTVAVALYNGVAAILRALGDSRSPLYFLIFASIVNVVLDLLFVLRLGLGVLGVALATIIAQLMAFLLGVVYAWRRVPYFRLSPGDLKPHPKLILRSLKLGFPVAMQSSMVSISMISLQGVVNGFGASVMAAYTVVMRVEELVQQPFSSLATAITSFSGQNMGARRVDRVKEGYRLAARLILIFSLSLIPVAYFFGEAVIRCFVKDPEVIAIGVWGLVIDSLFFFPLGMIHMPRGLLNGCGDSGFAMMNGVVEVICRIILANILTRIPGIGYWGIWITTGLTWGITGIFCIRRYAKGKWMELGIA